MANGASMNTRMWLSCPITQF